MSEIELHLSKGYLKHGLGDVARSNCLSSYINWGTRNPRKVTPL